MVSCKHVPFLRYENENYTRVSSTYRFIGGWFIGVDMQTNKTAAYKGRRIRLNVQMIEEHYKLEPEVLWVIYKWLIVKDKKLNIGFLELERKYFEIANKLNHSNKPAIARTSFENSLAKKIRQKTKLQFKRSFWVGNFNYDFFFHQLGEKGKVAGKGLVIEVDGAVHDIEPKMRKDQLKYQIAEILRIPVCSISNEDLRESTVASILDKLRRIRRLDTRARKRLLTDIYLFTIITHLSIYEFADLVQIPPSKLFIGHITSYGMRSWK